MRRNSEALERGHSAATAVYTSNMHGERTRVEVFTRVPDYHFRTFNMGQMGLIAMRCGSMSISREATDVRARSDRMSTFILEVRGQGAFSHYGNKILLEEGDFTLCDNSAQYDLRLDGPNEIILFRVPTAMVQDAIPSPDALCGRRLARHEGLTSMAMAMTQDLVARDPNRLEPGIGERAGRHLLDVLASSYMALPDDRNSASAVMSVRFWKVRLFIEEHLRDPELSPSFIARSMRLSDRYLRMIFALSDESPSAYILRRRLEECAAQLREPRWRSHSITTIAFSWGFNSASHFARSFRSQFCCSPRDYRHQEPS